VIVVDDGSTDGTGEMVRGSFPGVGLLTLPRNQGFAVAANRGLEKVASPSAALLNNDTEPDPDWVEKVLRGIDDYPESGFFASRMVTYHRPEILDSAGDIYLRTGLPLKRGNGLPAETFPVDEPVLAASAGAAAYRMEALHRTGFLDESFRVYLEDVDLSLQLQSAGYGCTYLAGARVRHREAASDPDRGQNSETLSFYSARRVYWITRNRWILMITWQPFRHLPWLAYGWSRSFLFHLFKAGFTREFLRGIRDGIAATPAAWRKRRLIQKSSPVPIKTLCRKYQK
jgi:GT2 family glycosyltransferase